MPGVGHGKLHRWLQHSSRSSLSCHRRYRGGRSIQLGAIHHHRQAAAIQAIGFLRPLVDRRGRIRAQGRAMDRRNSRFRIENPRLGSHFGRLRQFTTRNRSFTTLGAGCFTPAPSPICQPGPIASESCPWSRNTPDATDHPQVVQNGSMRPCQRIPKLAPSGLGSPPGAALQRSKSSQARIRTIPRFLICPSFPAVGASPSAAHRSAMRLTGPYRRLPFRLVPQVVFPEVDQ